MCILQLKAESKTVALLLGHNVDQCSFETRTWNWLLRVHMVKGPASIRDAASIC